MPQPAEQLDPTSSPVRNHVEMLHRLAAGVDGVLVVSVFNANLPDDKGIVTHHAIGDVGGMVDAIDAHSQTPGANCYVGLQVMRRGLARGSRGKEADIAAVLGLVADMDADTGKGDGEYPLPPNLVVETSPGNMQPFWLFDRPVAPAIAKDIAKGLKVATGSDHGTGDVCHVWRVPGTLNHPNKKKLARGRSPDPAHVTAAEPWDGTLTDPAALALAVAGRSAAVADKAPVALGEIPDVDGVEVSDKLAGLLAANEVGDRSAHAARVVEQLGFEGYAAEVAAALFLSASGDWFQRYGTEHRAVADFTRMWPKVAEPLAEARKAGEGIGARLLAGRKTAEPVVAANDNKPGLDIFAWRSSRFIGEPPPVEYLVEGVVPLRVPMMLAAMGDTGKSFVLLETGRRVAFGESEFSPPILGGRIKRRGTAVIITSEDDAGEVHRRLDALDARGDRFLRGDKLIVVPLPSAGGAIPFWRQTKNGLEETSEYRRIGEQLSSIEDLLFVGIDPLASFAHLQINEDPAAGQFVCSSLGRLAAETGATVAVAHHMKKTTKAVESLAEARDAIRGSTALVDGLRLAYALWPAEAEKAKKICREIGKPYSPNALAFGGVVKANGAARRILSTYHRNDFGLLVDVTALTRGRQVADQGDLRTALVIAIEAAAAAGSPFTKTGQGGLYEMREGLPEDLRDLPRGKLDTLAEEALTRGEIVKAKAKGEKTAKWLDVPTGLFAAGMGEFRAGMKRAG
ncbi:AAA family ATPase [Aminobacter niigataensis]|uniref:AAA family ATPase n=1 Tax=Aminobacter niigataensis TaxID=83265 RepID=UPI0024C566B2|nr:AAA family ATPase [Aminobacter niigataensis]CAI2935040.1 protein of unknown function [Aminobacter niigataensis]